MAVEPDDVEKQQQMRAALPPGFVPVLLSEQEVNNFYVGYANSSLWPLLHNMIPYARFNREWYDVYHTVNQMFADR